MTSKSDPHGHDEKRLVLDEGAGRMEVRKQAFLKSHKGAAKTLSQNFGRLVKNPDEEAIHDARTAIRRVEAQLALLPKSVRKSPEVRELRERYGRAMATSAKVRDLDIVRAKVSSELGQDSQLLEGIAARRRSAAEAARKAAASARALVVPTLSVEVGQAKLQRRFEKVVDRLEDRIGGLLPVVTADPGRMEELHRLRIACKKLRYTLELAPEGRSRRVLSLMEGWQDALGAIRDWDVTIAYLKREGSPSAEGLLRKGVAERDREHRAFARSVVGPR